MSYRYASEKTREIGCNVPFAIVGATQVPFAACLITRMDQGHGLLDRFLFIFPTCLRPSLQDTEDALSWLESQPLESLTDVFLELEMFEYHGQRKVVYKFTDSPQSLLNDLQNQEIHDINEAIKERNPHPKCKKMGLIKGRFTPHLQPYRLKASRRHSAGPATPENNRTLRSRG